MWAKIIKFTGLIIIIAFSAISIFFSIVLRDLPEGDPKKSIFFYTSFFEDRFYDFRMRQTLDPKAFDSRLVMADIDDYSLKSLGQWPVERSTWTNIIDKLNAFGAKVIAFDVFFAENSKTCDGYNPDINMAESIKRFQSLPGRKVIIPYNLNHESHHPENFQEMPDTLFNFMIETRQSEGVNLNRDYVSKAVFPIQGLMATDAALGHIVASADLDGIMRHYQSVGNIDDLYLPNYGLIAYQHFTGDQVRLDLLNQEEYKLTTSKTDFYLNSRGETKIRFLGKENAFPRVPIYEIYNAAPDDPKMIETFKDKLVFVGSSAFGAHDLRHTPVDAQLPGVYVHMNFVHMLLEGKTFRQMNDSTIISWIILFGGSLLVLVIQLLGNPIVDLLTVVTALVATVYSDLQFFTPQGYEIKLFFCLFSMVACYSWSTFLHFYLANKDKAFLKSAFSSYISPELIDEMYANSEPPKLGGDCGVRTAFFTDIQGFSTFSEKLDAQNLVVLLNEYLTAMTDILLQEKGTLDKYEGDAIIAFFGAPMPLADHATRACRVAHLMQERLLELRQKWASEGDKWPLIVQQMRMRIGINSGEIVTGNMGSASRMNYTMMGDAVNLAARLEESAKQYGIFTQISKDAVDLAGSDILVRELDTILVVGKSIPTTTYDLLGMKKSAPEYLQQLASRFKEGIELYKKQMWEDAILVFNETLELEYQRFPDLKGIKTNPSEIYIKRCEEYKLIAPPPGWEGVYVLTSK